MKRTTLLSAFGLAALAAAFAFSPVYAAKTTTSTAAVAPTTTTDTAVPVVDNTASKNDEGGNDGTYERAIVLSTANVSSATSDGAQQLQTYTIQFLSGPYAGKTRLLSSDVATNPYRLEPRPGDKILVFLQPNPSGGEPLMYLESFDRRAAMYWLIALFVLTLVLLAGWQGVKVAFSIFLSILLIGFILIPSFIKGLNPVPIALGIAAILTAVSTVLTTGWNRKSLVTTIGTVGGVLVAWLVASTFANWAHLSGLASDDDRLFFDKNPLLNPQGLLFAGIIIAALGVVEDVAVSIASGVMEVRQANTRLGFKDLFRSGMVVGRDHMGALANTLVFVYVGGSLSTLLLYAQNGASWAKFINFDVVVDEILRSLAGTIGLVFTVPITALLAAYFALRWNPLLRNTEAADDSRGWRGEHKHDHDSQG